MIHLPDHEIAFFGYRRMSVYEYKKLFREGVLNGEKTPSYVRKRESMEDIYNLIPKVKLIISLRNPIQAIHSMFAQRVRAFAQKKKTGINPEEHKFEDVIRGDINLNAVVLSNFDYARHIKDNVLPFFNDSQITIIIQEEMEKDSSPVLEGVLDFLETGHENIYFGRQIYHDKDLKYDCIDYSTKEYRNSLKKIIEYYMPLKEDLIRVIGREIDEWNNIDQHYTGLLR